MKTTILYSQKACYGTRSNYEAGLFPYSIEIQNLSFEDLGFIEYIQRIFIDLIYVRYNISFFKIMWPK